MSSQNQSLVTGNFSHSQRRSPLVDLDLNTVILEPNPTPQLAPKTKLPDWTDEEMKVLIAAKKDEHENTTMTGSMQKRMTSAKLKWKEVAQFMLDEGCTNPIRDAASCKKKWQMIEDKFKKVYDWEKKGESSQMSYFDMDDKERKSKQLPINFNIDLYTEVVQWYSDVARINPNVAHLSDSSAMDRNPDRNPFVNLSSKSDKEVEDEDRNRNCSPMRSTAPHSESVQERSGGPSSPQDFTAPDRRGVKRKQTPTKERSALMTSMVESCAEMVKATKRDMEIRERDI